MAAVGYQKCGKEIYSPKPDEIVTCRVSCTKETYREWKIRIKFRNAAARIPALCKRFYPYFHWNETIVSR